MAFVVALGVIVPSRCARTSPYPMSSNGPHRVDAANEGIGNLFEPAAKNQHGYFHIHMYVAALRKLRRSTSNYSTPSVLSCPKANYELYTLPPPLRTVHNRGGVAFCIAVNGFAKYVILIIAALILPSYLAGQPPSIRNRERCQKILWLAN